MTIALKIPIRIIKHKLKLKLKLNTSSNMQILKIMKAN